MALSVDRIQGLSGGLALKAPCRTATTENIAHLNGLSTVGGVALAAGDRVLVKDQTDSKENGVYTADTGDWKRALDFNGPSDVVNGTWVTVTSGTSEGYVFKAQATDSTVIPGISEITFDGGLFTGDFSTLFAASDGSSLVGFIQAGVGAVARTAQDKMRERVSVTDFGAVGDGATDDTAAFTASYTALSTAGLLSVGTGTFMVAGGTTDKTISLVGKGAGATILKNATNGATILSCNQSGMGDKERRNWLSLRDFTITDSAAGTGKGVVLNGVLSVDLERLYVREFTSGRGLEILEGLWVYLNHVNTDQSEVYLYSAGAPHFNNCIVIKGGEYRNPADGKSALHIENADIVTVSDGVAIEGDAGGSAYVSGGTFKNVQQLRISDTYFEVLPRATDGALVLDACQEVDISSSLLNSQSDSTPSLKIKNGTRRVTVRNSRLSFYCVQAESNSGSLAFEGCSFDGKIDIADGVNFTMRRCGPATSTAIPVVPSLQPDTTHSRTPHKNWFIDSSFASAALVTTIQAGTPITSHVTSDGYYDTNCTSIAGVANDKVRTEAIGTTDAIGDRVCITFMAKATTKQDFNFIVFADGAKGGCTADISTEWRRYFIFGNDAGVSVGGSSILMDVEFTGSNILYIDDVQTVAFADYAKASEVIDNFRYVPTKGVRVTSKITQPISLGGIYKNVVYDPPSLAPGAAGTAQTTTVTGAALGDQVTITGNIDMLGQRAVGYVSAANTVKWYVENPTANPFGTNDLASTTFNIVVTKI